MKFTRQLFTFISIFICYIASAAIDVNVLTRGGWDCGSKWCYFFEIDGNCDVVGSTTVSMKWAVEPDGSLKLSDVDGNIEYVDVKGSLMRWRDGREGYHCPFAEKSNEISLREGRERYDLTWRPPHSANTLADKLYLKSWISESQGASMSFFRTDTCIVSDFVQLNINQKYLWEAIDAESIRLTAMIPPYGSKIVKVKMHPGAFDLTDNGTQERYILNAYYTMDALGATFDMCMFPLGCYGFFSESTDEVMSYFDRIFSGAERVGEFSVYIVGYHWTCDGVIVTPDERRVSYVNYPGNNAAIEESFQYMTTILNNLFSPIDSPTGDNTRIFIDQSMGDLGPLLITLSKVPDSTHSNDNMRNGFVSLTICNK